MVGVEQWAEIRRLVLVERRSQRQVAKSLGLARDTVARALASDAPPCYARAPVVSKLDPFREWICEQLRVDPSIQSLRLREMATELGYQGGKSTFDDYVREVRPRFQVRRTFQRRSDASADNSTCLTTRATLPALARTPAGEAPRQVALGPGGRFSVVFCVFPLPLREPFIR